MFSFNMFLSPNYIICPFRTPHVNIIFIKSIKIQLKKNDIRELPPTVIFHFYFQFFVFGMQTTVRDVIHIRVHGHKVFLLYKPKQSLKK